MKTLIIQYFKHSDNIRRQEIDYCCKRNLKDKNFDNHIILLEKEDDYQEWMKGFEYHNLNKRPTFKDIIDYSNNIEGIKILANLDIFFDNTINMVNGMNDKDFFALTRWDINMQTKQAKFFNVNCSGDVWIWKNKVDTNVMNIDWFLGKPGIDNLVCGAFHENGYNVLNPSLTIKTYHLHSSKERSYTDADVVKGRLYFLYPTTDMVSKIRFWKNTDI